MPCGGDEQVLQAGANLNECHVGEASSGERPGRRDVLVDVRAAADEFVVLAGKVAIVAGYTLSPGDPALGDLILRAYLLALHDVRPRLGPVARGADVR